MFRWLKQVDLQSHIHISSLCKTFEKNWGPVNHKRVLTVSTLNIVHPYMDEYFTADIADTPRSYCNRKQAKLCRKYFQYSF